MDKRLIDVDPLSGIQTWHHYDHATEQSTILEVQDVEPALERAKALRNDRSYSAKGIKDNLWHYATIPNIIVTKIFREHGLDIFHKDNAKRVRKIIDTEYPLLKNTTGRHT